VILVLVLVLVLVLDELEDACESRHPIASALSASTASCFFICAGNRISRSDLGSKLV
jgi:hypothetical protein